MKQSAGILAYRRSGDLIEVLIAHPGGPFWAKRDEGVWSIPKGEVDDGEDLLLAARREFSEELGVPSPDGPYVELGVIIQKAGKEVSAWAVETDVDPDEVLSNTFTIEWPPRSAGRQSFLKSIEWPGWRRTKPWSGSTRLRQNWSNDC